MKTRVYCILLFITVCLPLAQAQRVYQGKVKVKTNSIKVENGKLELDMEISVQGLSVSRYHTLSLIPVLRSGADSLIMQPIVLNGINKQKMYKRTLALNGKREADKGAYMVLKNMPLLLVQIPYQQSVPYRNWMHDAQLVLIGESCNYYGTPIAFTADILTEHLDLHLTTKKKKVE